MDFLKRAQDYAAKRGDENWFAERYTQYREWYNVQDSVWCALTWLYDEDTAKLLKYQYWGPAL
jgi:hypothetical protein